MMKRHVLALLLGLAMAGGASAESAHYHTGVTRLAVADVEPFDAVVWYPTAAAAIPWRAGELPVAASRDAAPGVDRAAIHRRLEGKISDFLQQNL
jgi:hypothetical protein